MSTLAPRGHFTPGAIEGSNVVDASPHAREGLKTVLGKRPFRLRLRLPC